MSTRKIRGYVTHHRLCDIGNIKRTRKSPRLCMQSQYPFFTHRVHHSRVRQFFGLWSAPVTADGIPGAPGLRRNYDGR